jgi:hypothetical protein
VSEISFDNLKTEQDVLDAAETTKRIQSDPSRLKWSRELNARESAKRNADRAEAVLLITSDFERSGLLTERQADRLREQP